MPQVQKNPNGHQISHLPLPVNSGSCLLIVLANFFFPSVPTTITEMNRFVSHHHRHFHHYIFYGAMVGGTFPILDGQAHLAPAMAVCGGLLGALAPLTVPLAGLAASTALIQSVILIPRRQFPDARVCTFSERDIDDIQGRASKGSYITRQERTRMNSKRP